MPTQPPSYSPPKFHPTLHPFNTPVSHWLAANPRHHLLVSALVTTSPSPKNDSDEKDGERVLLLQRAPTDYVPLAWEFPGGTCEPDETILQAVARELREESGLVAQSVDAVVDEREVPEPRWIHVEGGGEVELELKGVRPMWRMVCFLVTVEETGIGIDTLEGGLPVVRLDPEEHCAFCWASEEDVKGGWCGGVRLEWDHAGGERREVILRGFEVLRERRERGMLQGGGGGGVVG